MDTEEFRRQAKKTVDYLCDYRETVAQRRVAPGEDIQKNYLRNLISGEAPQKGESYDKLLEDFETKIMPGVVHWNHPRFHAYFASGHSYPSVLGDLLSSATGAIGFSWKSSPAHTELELIVMDMYAKALDLPKFFLSDHPGSIGGGAMQGSASECVLVALIAARARAIKQLKGDNRYLHESIFLPHLVAYTSEEAHSCVQKAAKMAIIKLRVLKTDSRGCLRGETLAKAIDHDVREEGLTPIFVSATVGTTGTCAFDRISELGQVCKRYSTIWFHVDGAYGGNSFILPEMRHFKEGLEYADSFNTNPNKLLLTSFDCSCLWVRSVPDLKEAMVVNPEYLRQSEKDGEELRHYGIPLSRRFRSLKLWFVLRNYGIEGLQKYIRNHIKLAKRFEAHVKTDDRFSLENDVHLGLVCFRLNIDSSSVVKDKVNAELLDRINSSGELHMIPTKFRDIYMIRFCVTFEFATEEHIDTSWRIIQQFATDILADFAKRKLKCQQRDAVPPSSRFSFTRSVSRDVYDHQPTSLRDGSTPVVMIDTNELAEAFEVAMQMNHKSDGESDVSN